MNRRRIITFGILAFAAISGIAYLFWPRPYVWYTSLPLDRHGTSVEFLIPRGWSRDPAFPGEINLKANRHPDWWPSWLEMLFPMRDEYVSFRHHRTRQELWKHVGGRWFESVQLELPDGSVAVLEYGAKGIADADFRRTSSHIRNSVRIVY